MLKWLKALPALIISILQAYMYKIGFSAGEERQENKSNTEVLESVERAKSNADAFAAYKLLHANRNDK